MAAARSFKVAFFLSGGRWKSAPAQALNGVHQPTVEVS